MKSFVFNPERCDLCRKCEEACINCLREKEYPYPFPPIRIVVNKGRPFLSVCRQCEVAPCVDVCIAGAMQREKEEDFILYNPKKCIGCMMCNLVCPWGMVIPLYGQKKVLKCSGRCNKDSPPCVDVCDRHALFFETPLKTIKKSRRARSELFPIEKIRP